MSVGDGAVFMVKEDLGNPVKSAFQPQGFLGLTRGTWKQPGALQREKESVLLERPCVVLISSRNT